MAFLQMPEVEYSGSCTHDYFDEWKKWCRLCARANVQYINIISGHCEPSITTNSEYSNVLGIAVVIEEFLKIHIKEDDKFSQLICTDCFNAINSMIKFRERAFKVQHMYNDLQNEEFRCKLNPKDLYELYNLNEKESFVPNNTNELQVEEIFVADLPCTTVIAADATAVEVKNENKTDETPAKISQNNFEKEEEFFDPIGDEDDISRDSSVLADGTLECSDDEDSDEDNEVAKVKKKSKLVPVKDEEDLEFNYPCKKCDQKFQRIKNYVSHMKKKHREIICPQCPKSFKTAMNLRQHIKDHPSDFTCPHCDKKLESRVRLARHIRCAHDHDQPLICEVCGITLRTKKQLKEHMLQHTDYAPYDCKVCGASFKVKSRLKRHMQIHGDKYICPECGKQLSTRATLKSHLLVHSDKMAHKCDYCGRLFKRANTLKNHLIAHTDLRPYACDFCDKRFSTGPSCRFHKKTMHPKELAELEASGAKAYTKNIPTLHVLKAVSKTGENFKPLASKQTGFVHFDKGVQSTTTDSANELPITNIPKAE